MTGRPGPRYPESRTSLSFEKFIGHGDDVHGAQDQSHVHMESHIQIVGPLNAAVAF